MIYSTGKNDRVFPFFFTIYVNKNICKREKKEKTIDYFVTYYYNKQVRVQFAPTLCRFLQIFSVKIVRQGKMFHFAKV